MSTIRLELTIKPNPAYDDVEVFDFLDHLRNHQCDCLEISDELFKQLYPFCEDLRRIDGQLGRLISWSPTQEPFWRDQHRQAEQEIAAKISKLNVPGVRKVVIP